MTEQIISKQTLKNKLNAIIISLPQKSRKYYHLVSVHNFIEHLTNFASERTQNRKAIEIDNYLNTVNERLCKEHDIHETAKELFPPNWKMSDEYRHELGFIHKPSYLLQLILWIILYFIIKAGAGSLVAFGCLSVIAIATIIYFQLKIKAKKYY